MKKALIIILAGAAFFASCAQKATVPTNEAAQRYFNAWMSVNHPSLYKEGHLGTYVVSDEEITLGKSAKHGQKVGDAKFLFMTMTIRSLDGTISSTNDPEIGKQLGNYSDGAYWGAGCFQIGEGLTYKGVEDAIKGTGIVADASATYEGGMKVGFKRTAIMPGWMISYDRYSSYSDYLANVTGDNQIYEITISDFTDDIVKWQIDTMEKSEVYRSLTEGIEGAADSLKLGFYFATLKAGTDTVKLPTDTTVYVNYVARLLNGQVFDTNIADTAKVHKIYSASRKYTPMSVSTAENVAEYKSSSSDDSSDGSELILGFNEVVSRMHKFEKAIGMFTSNYAYGAKAQSNGFPSYSPMIFEIELVEKPSSED